MDKVGNRERGVKLGEIFVRWVMYSVLAYTILVPVCDYDRGYEFTKPISFFLGHTRLHVQPCLQLQEAKCLNLANIKWV